MKGLGALGPQTVADGGFYWETLWNTICNIYQKSYTL